MTQQGAHMTSRIKEEQEDTILKEDISQVEVNGEDGTLYYNGCIMSKSHYEQKDL